MLNLKKEYKIAITVVIALGVLIWGVNFLKGKNIFSSGLTFHAVYSDLEGLTEASPVFFHGYKVGSVRNIEFHPERDKKFIVTLSLEKELPLYKSTVAQIYSSDLMGTMAIQLLDGTPDVLLEPGDTLKTSIKEGLLDQMSTTVMPLKDKVESLVVKIDSAISGLSTIFSDANTQNLSEGMKSLSYILKNLENATAQLNREMAKGGSIHNTLASIDTITGTVNQNRDAIVSTLNNMSRFSDELARLNLNAMAFKIDSTLRVLNVMLQQVQNGEGSLGLLLSDEDLYYNLLDASANLNKLLADVRHNPGRYINISAFDFGKNVNIMVDDEEAKNKEITYKVKVAQSDVPLDIKNKLIRNKFRIIEESDGKRYTYTVGESHSYREIISIRDEIAHQYPNAQIVAFRKGKPVKVNKALKLSERKN
ncbi:MlaD family protein [Thermophagus xiamenensis]|uniref:Phospholipid/cholesterol/gamma-HCH transport system substrate-binding protein n=1 Tax=Thermophagus xiamenensis TaxID=385682 RepID=A0A1I1W9Z5_9BACT|nr:MlaD family protein [Thermophagus xiamenensis]SFD91871.1 phospholipid/cholesterol/gamma-HCH transport system substrate-binding protein [Thermophagus xiamenensis]